MVTHTAQVRGRKIAWDKREVVQHGLNADRIKFDLDAEFRCCDSYQVVLCGPSLESPKRYIPDKDMTVAVPPSLMESTGPVSTCLLGYVGGEVRVVTAQERYPLVVVESGFTGPLDPGEEQPDLWAQIMSAEAARIEAELVREAAETARADAEAKRIAAEKARETASAEAVKAANEAAAKAEQAARRAEDRVTAALAEVAEAEQARDEAEEARAAAESSRAEAEAARIAAESKRESAEAKRKADSAKAVADASAATSAANAAAGKADAAAQTATDGEASRVAAETARAKAEQAREGAETGRVEAEKVRVIADAERGERVDESVQKADAATAKATEAAGKATASATEADAAAKRADEAAKGASENVLVGTETATVVHVEDAWPTLLRECKVLGKSVQDGSPTPDAPKPITSVGKAEVVTAGKNLISLDERVLTSHGITVTSHTDGTFTLDGTGDSQGLWFKIGEADLVAGQTYTLSLSKKHATLGVSLWSAADNQHVLMVTQGSDSKTTAVKKSERVTVFLVGGAGASYSNDETSVQLEIGSRSGFTPHVPSVSASIDLQGHELRSLPNGVRDEVVVDREGNASLVQRVGSVTVDDSSNVIIAGKYFVARDGIPDYIGGADFDARRQRSTWAAIGNADRQSEKCIAVITYDGAATIRCSMPDGVDGLDQLKTYLKQAKPRIDYQLAAPQTIPLGKVSVPALPESTSNVWNADAIQTEVSSTYVRDVNIAFSKLESKLTQAVVAAAANL